MKQILYSILPLLCGIIIGFYLRGSISAVKTIPHESIIKPTSNEPAVAHQPAHADDRRIGQNNQNADGFSISEIQAALGRLKNIADLHERSSRLKTLLQRWAELDGRGAFKYVNSMDEGEMKLQAMLVVAAELVHSDPQFLAEQTLTMPNNHSSRELVDDLSKSWSQTDPQSALAWAEQLPDGLGRNDALVAICLQLGKQNPAAVSEQISQLPSGDFRNSLIGNLAAEWGNENPAAALDWANTLPDAEKSSAMSNLIGAWAQHDPMAAATFAAQLPPGEMQNQAVMSAVLGWADQNPADAAAWVLEFPNDNLREQGIKEVISAWTSNDSDAAIDWVKELPEGTIRDAALNDLVESVAYWSPDKAAAIVPMIDDPARQEETMKTILRLWSETDPASAKNWLAHLDITAELKAQLSPLLSSN